MCGRGEMYLSVVIFFGEEGGEAFRCVLPGVGVYAQIRNSTANRHFKNLKMLLPQ